MPKLEKCTGPEGKTKLTRSMAAHVRLISSSTQRCVRRQDVQLAIPEEPKPILRHAAARTNGSRTGPASPRSCAGSASPPSQQRSYAQWSTFGGSCMAVSGQQSGQQTGQPELSGWQVSVGSSVGNRQDSEVTTTY